MREIKFRVLIKGEKTETPMMWLQDNEWCLSPNGKPIYDDRQHYQNLEYPQIVAINQYTGIKDKNGTEIYESDILRQDDRLYPNLKVWKVIYKDASFILQDIKQSHHTTLNSSPWTGEVIGNIYQNPEILEV